MASILVAYSTRNGSTQEVAEALATRLVERGVAAEARRAEDVIRVEGFDAVVLGAPLYSMRWDPPALRFAERNRSALTDLPVAVFALGPLASSDRAFAGSRRQFERSLKKVRWLEPAAVEVFGGVNPRGNRADARDWTAIRGWADAIPTLLRLTVADNEGVRA